MVSSLLPLPSRLENELHGGKMRWKKSSKLKFDVSMLLEWKRKDGLKKRGRGGKVQFHTGKVGGSWYD